MPLERPWSLWVVAGQVETNVFLNFTRVSPRGTPTVPAPPARVLPDSSDGLRESPVAVLITLRLLHLLRDLMVLPLLVFETVAAL